MENVFSPQELLKIAVGVEENGKSLYEILENKAKDEKIKAIWKYLKEQEEIHRQIFKQMLDDVGSYIVYEFSPGEYDAYLKAIASSYIFTQELIKKKIKELFNSELEAVDFGIYIEKESILALSALKEYITSDKKAVLNKIIAEERKHLVCLTSLKHDVLK